ncbi:MAG: lipoprotein NlpI [Aeromonadales bacterium]|nr:lipoprotein NlpI [Aeromonadales bacterium]MDY2891551.1 lipoprotein NlpI [Succinivibrio sp.]
MKRLFRAAKARGALVAAGLVLAAALSACSSTGQAGPDPEKARPGGPFRVPAEYVMFPQPFYGSSERDQALLFNVSQLLDTKARTHRERAEVFYELGIIYDRLGLEATARTMFMNALVENRKYAAPYNFIGIYFAEDGRYQEALDAFDSSLELDGSDRYVNFSRGIVLYYAGRPQVALPDFEAFYKADRSDPYRQLWLFLCEERALGRDKALANLKRRYAATPAQAAGDNWGFDVVRLYCGELPLKEFFARIKASQDRPDDYADHLCEGYFYVGKLSQMDGDDALACDYFSLCAATHRYGFLEYRYALREIRSIKQKYGLPAGAGPAASGGSGL